jgi:membrane protease YdiL (CAAX protease family)
MSTTPADGPSSYPAPPEQPERPSVGPPGATGSGGSGDSPAARAIPSWPGWSAPAALLAGFAGALVLGLVIALIGALFGADLDHAPASVSIASVVAQDVCLIGAALLFARAVTFPRPRQFGLNRPRSLPQAAALVVGGYLVFIVISYLWLTAIGQSGAKDTITEDLGAKDSTIALVFVTFVVTVCAPLAEEFLFRGYFFGALRSNGFWFAAFFTGLAFGTVHVFGSPIAFIVPLALLGMGLCLIREKTASLYPGIALHCLNNSLAMASSEHWSWEVPVVLIGAPALIATFIWLGLRAWPEPGARTAPVSAAAPTG